MLEVLLGDQQDAFGVFGGERDAAVVVHQGPYSLHQLTTDPSTLESGEYSVVKNFDFVALFFVNILDVFLGVYNVTPEALLFLRAALNAGGETLRQRVFAKIGAPLTSFQINDLTVSPTSGDRVVTHLGIGLPKPLNVIELHLVA